MKRYAVSVALAAALAASSHSPSAVAFVLPTKSTSRSRTSSVTPSPTPFKASTVRHNVPTAATVLNMANQGRTPGAEPPQDIEDTTQTALDKYGIDFTEKAKEGKLDPVIGRDDEIRRAIQILSRRTKNNPVLIGDPGVGKTVRTHDTCLVIR
mmetsp:Transcript_21312/g.43786  ORF Transcript_21312/g.43786 Transcript_21312/m.43786 type:complete len:153 (-) Transcript_21312:2360-2818(-)